MRSPRIIHHFYARLAGYFWIPCPLCGRKFGGHEVGASAKPGIGFWPIEVPSVTGRAICPRCTAAGYGGWPLDEKEGPR